MVLDVFILFLKGILYQTKKLRNLLRSFSNCCCNDQIDIFLPFVNHEILELTGEFLFKGEIFCENAEILNTTKEVICDIFGFPGSEIITNDEINIKLGNTSAIEEEEEEKILTNGQKRIKYESGDDMLESGLDENVESLHSLDQENENNNFDWNHHDEEIVGCES